MVIPASVKVLFCRSSKRFYATFSFSAIYLTPLYFCMITFPATNLLKSSCPPILSTFGLRTRKLVMILDISLSAHGSYLSTVWSYYLHYQSFDISYLRCLFPPIENNGWGSEFNSSLVLAGPMCIFYVTIFCDFWYCHSFENF